jgi:drug/metabolite transporter (DMT)-like permease
MSLVSSDRVPIGIAQTLCSFTPILILPFAVRVHGERIGPRAILGAALAVMGIAVLFGGTV